MQLLIVGVMPGIHYLAITYLWWLIYALMVPVIIGCVALTRNLQQLPWNKIGV